jgi:Uncharacterized flagellar protein FlaG
VLGAINRVDGTNRDWSQANTAAKNGADKTPVDVKITGINAANQQLSEADKEKLYKEVEKVNEQLRAQNHSFRFKFSEEAEQFYMQVIDLRTQEVVDSIPSEHMIELAAKLKDMIGFFIDEKL